MHIYTFERTQLIPRSIEDTFAFFADAANLEAITPGWLNFKIMTSSPIQMRAGTNIAYRLKLKGFPMDWLTEIRTWEPPCRFVDIQLRGPYRLWEHEHTFEAVDKGTLMRDVVRYCLPFGILGRLAHYCLVRRDLNRIFAYRADRVATLLGSELNHV